MKLAELAAERRSDAEPLGLCGLFKRDSLPLPDLGYGLATRHAGQGYAREAARACLAYAQRVLGRDELLAITSPTNGPSMALLQDLGFVREGERVVILRGSQVRIVRDGIPPEGGAAPKTS